MAPSTQGNSADVSVIIPAYQASCTIERALRSASVQTVQPREIVVIDDGSTDGTAAIIQGFMERSKDVSLVFIRQSNLGPGAARNAGLAAAQGKYVAFLDADDEWLPQKLERSLDAMKKQNLAFVSHNVRVDTGKTTIDVDCARAYLTFADPWVGLYRKGFVSTSTVVAERAVLVAVGGFDNRLANGQDFDLWLSALDCNGIRFAVIDEFQTINHATPGSITSYTNRRLDCCLAIAQRHLKGVRQRDPSAIRHLLYRVAAVHYEAFRAHLGRGSFASATGVLVKAAVRLPLAAAGLPLIGKSAPVHAFGTELFLWAWTAAAFAIFVVQVQDLFGPVVRLFGFG